MNLIIFTSYFIIIASVIGYGSILQKVFNKKLNLEFEYSLLSTILFLIVISFFTHFFLSHNYLHNGVIIIFGLFFFFIMIIKDKKLFKSYAKYILLIFSILFFGLLIAKS